MSVYFAQRRQHGLIKIGYSRNVANRLQQMGAKMLGVVPGDRVTEKELHKRFDHLRARGEWFRPGDDLLTYIRTEAQGHKPDASGVRQVAVRVPTSWLTRADKIAESMSQPGMRVTRTEVLQLATYRGVDQLETEGQIL